MADCVVKLKQQADRIDGQERDNHSAIESLAADLKSLRAGSVTTASHRQHANSLEQRFEQEKQDLESRLDQMKLAIEKEISSGITNLRLKTETLNANCLVMTEKCKVLEETVIPAVKAEVEEQKAKRLCETQRLEAEGERMKESCEQKISHTAAALRFYVTATATKLREELTALTLTKELEEDLKQKETNLKKQLKGLEDQILLVKEDVIKHKASSEETVEHHTKELGQHTKAIKVAEITLNNLQTSVASDLNDVRELLRTDRAALQTEIADARAVVARNASHADSAIQACVSEIAPLRQFRELVVERLHIEKFVNIVRDWQSSHMPQVTSAVKDLEERARKLLANQAKDHEIICELQKSNTEVRRHFRMFHAIAAGLDDKPMPSLPDPVPVPPEVDSRLPPIQTPSSQTQRDGFAASAPRPKLTPVPPSGRRSPTPVGERGEATLMPARERHDSTPRQKSK